MKKLIPTIGLTAVLFSGIAQAQNKDTKVFEAICLSAENIEKVTKDFNELPYLRAVSDREDSTGKNVNQYVMVLYINLETKTWTLVEKVDKVYCVIASGDNMTVVSNEIRKNIEKQRNVKPM
jgi:transcription antitermination factor NusG